MSEKTGFFEEKPGVKSSTRLIVATVISTGLSMCLGMIVIGLWAFHKETVHDFRELLTLGQAVATVFGTTVIGGGGLKIAHNMTAPADPAVQAGGTP
jgi:hypothetical protein